jgi:hypothetical protein
LHKDPKSYYRKIFLLFKSLNKSKFEIKKFKHYGNMHTRFLKIIVNLLTNLILEAYTIMNGIIEIHNIVKHSFPKIIYVYFFVIE